MLRHGGGGKDTPLERTVHRSGTIVATPILAARSPSPNPQTGNAQQCSRHKALMRHTAGNCFSSASVIPVNESSAGP